MTNSNDDPAAALRRGVYLLLIFVGVGAMLGRILAVDAVDRTAVEEYRVKTRLAEKRKALEKKGVARRETGGGPPQGKYPAGQRPGRCGGPSSAATTAAAGPPSGRWSNPTCACPDAPTPSTASSTQPNWDTIDMVKHKADDHLYSSKPPLLATLIAGEYWADLSARPACRWARIPYEDRPLHAGHAQRDSAGDLLPAPGRAGRAAGKVRLGPDFRHDRGRLRHVSDHLRRRAQQPRPGSRVRDDRALGRRADLVRRRAAAGGISPWWACRARCWWPTSCPGCRWPPPWAWPCCGRPRGRRCWPGCPLLAVVAAGFFGTNWIAHHSLRPPYMHNKGADNWYDYTYEHRRPAGRKLLEPSPGRGPGRAVAARSTPCTPWSATTASSP